MPISKPSAEHPERLKATCKKTSECKTNQDIFFLDVPYEAVSIFLEIRVWRDVDRGTGYSNHLKIHRAALFRLLHLSELIPPRLNPPSADLRLRLPVPAHPLQKGKGVIRPNRESALV
jgi:hypothetical protein